MKVGGSKVHPSHHWLYFDAAKALEDIPPCPSNLSSKACAPAQTQVHSHQRAFIGRTHPWLHLDGGDAISNS